MTRFLSEALQAREPFFRLGLRRLEAAHGAPNHDIRLSTRVLHDTQVKLRELGLDPRDTTAEELYHVLNERVKADDARLTRALRTRAATHVSAEADVVDGMVHALRSLPEQQRCFALKASRLKSIIKKVPPKKAMKQLGYRSVDSFLKHESPALMLAAGWLIEAVSWRKQLLEQYRRLTSADFESRPLSILTPNSPRWRELAERTVADTKHNVLSLKEMGAIVLLPLPHQTPAGAVTASLTLALHELNEIHAAGTFLKLCQVQPNFGELVQQVVRDEAWLNTSILDRPVPWNLIQRYFARVGDEVQEELFGPHVRAEDMRWRPAETVLQQLDPAMAFWDGTAHLGLLHDHRPVSLNIADAALNLCNHVPFERRLTQAFQRSLWHELLLQYLNRDTVEQTVTGQLQPQLATGE